MLAFSQFYVENINDLSCNFHGIVKVLSINVNKKLMKFTANVRQKTLVRYFRKANNECESICRHILDSYILLKTLLTRSVFYDFMAWRYFTPRPDVIC